MEYYQFTFEISHSPARDILIAQLSASGFNGFEERPGQLLAYVPLADLSPQELVNQLQIGDLKYSYQTIHERNWNADWESNFSPVMVTHPVTGQPTVYIRAYFHEAPQSVEHDIIITPKMSFGTGHHATTYMMVEQMLKMNLIGKTVFDFGTGTGLLAILAEKLGADKILATDNDEWSILNAEENIKTNNCEKITLQQSDTVPENFKADIILANINLHVIRGNLKTLVNMCKNDGVLLLSGFLNTDMNILSQDFLCHELEIANAAEKAGWLNLMVVARK